MWAKFSDMETGGYYKLKEWRTVWIEATEWEAIDIFMEEFNIFPLGRDFLYTEYDELEIDTLNEDQYPAIVIHKDGRREHHLAK